LPCLRGMGQHQSVQEVYRVIEALLVLHNMSIDFKDKPEDTWVLTKDPEDVNDENDGDREGMDVVGAAQVPAHETDDWLKEQGRRKRLRVFNELF
ncbi:hypothetical protein B0H16DRAFT_1323264, partial [Mycena metata]